MKSFALLSDALAENGLIHSHVSHSPPWLYRARSGLREMSTCILSRYKHFSVRSMDGALTGKDKSRPRVALRCASLATWRISSFVTSRRISVRSVFVITIWNKSFLFRESHFIATVRKRKPCRPGGILFPLQSFQIRCPPQEVTGSVWVFPS